MTAAKFADIHRRQVPDSIKRRRADFVLPSNAGIGPTRAALAKALKELRKRRGRFWPSRPLYERRTADIARARKGRPL